MYEMAEEMSPSVDLKAAGDGTPTDGELNESKVQEIMIPKTRFDEINKKYKDLADKVAEFEKVKQETEKKKAEELGEFEKLYKETSKEIDGYKSKSTQAEERAKHLETVVNELIENKLKDVPDEFKELIPDGMSAEEKLAWINKAESKGLFKKATGTVEIGKPMNFGAPNIDVNALSAKEKLLFAFNSTKKKQ
jgi:ribonucleoside-triphosphate reductase